MSSLVTFNETRTSDCYQNYYESNILITYLFYFFSLSLIMMSYIITYYMELYRKLYYEVRNSRNTIETIYKIIDKDESSDDESSDDESSDDESSDDDDQEDMSRKMDTIFRFMMDEIERSKKDK